MNYICPECRQEWASEAELKSHRADPYGVHELARARDDLERQREQKRLDDAELEKVKAFAKERGLELMSTITIEATIGAQHAIENDIATGRAKLAELARRVRTLATFNSSGRGIEAIEDQGERRAFRLALYEIADEMEEL